MNAAWRPSTMPQGVRCPRCARRPGTSTASRGWSPACCWTCRIAASSPPGWPAIVRTAMPCSRPTRKSGPSPRPSGSTIATSSRRSCSGWTARSAIGHVRYATCGGNDRCDAQPFERDHGRKAKWFAFAFNGQLANYHELKEELLAKGDYHLKRDTDTEIIMHSLAYELQAEDQEPDWVGVFGRIAERFDGAYNIVLITGHGELVVVRDPLGFRPLCIAEHGPLFGAASESVPLANLGFRNIRSLEPGTLAVANSKGVRIERFAPSPRQAHCFFEWIYFANVASTLDDRSVYLSRAALGKELARLEDVPLRRRHDRRAGARHGQGRRRRHGLRAGRPLGRGPDAQPLRRPDLHRGHGRPRRQGPAQVHAAARGPGRQARPAGRGQHRPVHDDAGAGARDPRPRRRAGDPPPRRLPADHRAVLLRHRHVAQERAVRHPVRRPARRRVSAAAQQAMARELGADSLRYLPVEAIARSVSLSPERLCRACITGHYPTPTGQDLYQIEARCPRDGSRRALRAGRAPAGNHRMCAKIGRPSRRYFRSKLVR